MYPVLLLALVATLFFPEQLSYASSGFVPCTGLDCSSCHLVELANNIIRWLVTVLFVVFAVLMTIAGFGLVTSGGNQAALEAAKTKFKNALIGIIIVMAAWLLVDTLLKAILPGGEVVIGTVPGPWQRVQCFEMVPPIDGPNTNTDPDAPPSAPGSLAPVTSSPEGSICYNGPAGTPVCFTGNRVEGGSFELAPGYERLGYTPPTGLLGPEVIAANPQLTPNLRLCDVTNCDAARRRGEFVYVDPFMVAQLENVRNGLPAPGDFRVNSGYRSPEYNRLVGGATHSRHQFGDAVDIAITPSNPQSAIITQCRANGATNVYTYSSGRHVHCDWRGARR